MDLQPKFIWCDHFSSLPVQSSQERKKPTRQKTNRVIRRVGLLSNEPFGLAELFFIQSSEESCAVRATKIELSNATAIYKQAANVVPAVSQIAKSPARGFCLDYRQLSANTISPTIKLPMSEIAMEPMQPRRFE